MATYPPVPPPPAPLPPAKKSNVLKWVLIGIGACFMLVVVAVVGLGLFVAQKAKQAGLDPDLIKKSPALAAAKMMVAANPTSKWSRPTKANRRSPFVRRRPARSTP